MDNAFLVAEAMWRTFLNLGGVGIAAIMLVWHLREVYRDKKREQRKRKREKLGYSYIERNEYTSRRGVI
jgi:peptide deformylase